MELLGYKINPIYPAWPLEKRIVINTINPHSFCVAKQDKHFEEALKDSDLLIPDGIGIVYAIKILLKEKIDRIAGANMHQHLLENAQIHGLKVFYLGSSPSTLEKITIRIHKEYPDVKVEVFSPPFKTSFSELDNALMIKRINQYSPDILFLGMTAPKQEKWAYSNKGDLNVQIISSIGAVFDFYAGTVKRAPDWIIDMHLEWLYRLIREPKRMWKRYILNNSKFVYFVFKEKFS